MLGNGGHPMPRVAVVAHAGKSFGGGLAELREVLAGEGCTDPLWYEVAKSRKAPKYARRALAHGAEVIFVWGGDGMVQRCIDAVAGTEAVLAILPAGTANLLAANLHVPADLAGAVRVGLHGDRRGLDTRIGERRAFRGHGRRRIRCQHDQAGRQQPRAWPMTRIATAIARANRTAGSQAARTGCLTAAPR